MLLTSDTKKEKPSSSTNSSQRRVRGGSAASKHKTGRAEDKQSKRIIKSQGAKRKPTSKKHLETVNHTSPTQTKRIINIPVIKTKLLNYMVNNKANNPVEEKMLTKKDEEERSLKNKKGVEKKMVERDTIKEKSKKLKRMNSAPDKSSSESSLRSLLGQRSHIPEKDNTAKQNKLNLKKLNSPPDTSIRRPQREHGLEAIPTVVEHKSKTNLKRLIKRKVRSQVWRMAKGSIKASRHWQSVCEENNIIIDNIRPEAISLNLINVDALGIQSKFAKRTLTWLLK